MAADARRRDLEAVGAFAKNLGLAFQIEDDLLDVLATSAETGKDAGQDAGKVTFVKLLGVDGRARPRRRAARVRARVARAVRTQGRGAARLVEFVARATAAGEPAVAPAGGGRGGPSRR